MKKKITPVKPAANTNQEVLDLFSENLKKAVEARGVTAYALAKSFGFDKQAISNMLIKGRDPKLSSVLRIVKAMKISMDRLIGIAPEAGQVKTMPASEVETKKENMNLINKISKMPDQDIELLEVIADVLDKRRFRAMAKLFNAVKDAKPALKGEEEGLMAKAAKLQNFNTKGSLSADDDDEGNGLDDDDFDDDFEDDNFDEDDDFDEDDEDFGDDDDDLYEDDDDFDEDDD